MSDHPGADEYPLGPQPSGPRGLPPPVPPGASGRRRRSRRPGGGSCPALRTESIEVITPVSADREGARRRPAGARSPPSASTRPRSTCSSVIRRAQGRPTSSPPARSPAGRWSPRARSPSAIARAELAGPGGSGRRRPPPAGPSAVTADRGRPRADRGHGPPPVLPRARGGPDRRPRTPRARSPQRAPHETGGGAAGS